MLLISFTTTDMETVRGKVSEDMTFLYIYRKDYVLLVV